MEIYITWWQIFGYLLAAGLLIGFFVLIGYFASAEYQTKRFEKKMLKQQAKEEQRAKKQFANTPDWALQASYNFLQRTRGKYPSSYLSVRTEMKARNLL